MFRVPWKETKEKRINEVEEFGKEISLVWCGRAQTLQRKVTPNNSQYQLQETFTAMHVWYICVYTHTHKCMDKQWAWDVLGVCRWPKFKQIVNKISK